MYISTIRQLTKEDFKKAFELGKMVYEYEKLNSVKTLFRYTKVARSKNKLITLLEDYGLDVKDTDLNKSKDDLIHVFENYDLSSTNVAWASYFIHALIDNFDHVESVEDTRNVITMMSESFMNPGYADVFYNEVYNYFKMDKDCVNTLMKKSYYDTYGIEY